MSRVGKLPVKLPSGVNVSVEGKAVRVSGSNGNLSQVILPGVNVETKEGEITVSPKHQDAASRANQGLMRALINNMVIGVSEGYERQLEINGVGYRVHSQGADLKFNLGFSHEVVYKVPDTVSAIVEQNVITISGPNKQQVGQVTAEIRALKKPEPYKGKGIKYVEERIIRKSGKSGKEVTA